VIFGEKKKYYYNQNAGEQNSLAHRYIKIDCPFVIYIGITFCNPTADRRRRFN